MPRVQKQASQTNEDLDRLSVNELHARLQQYLEKPWVRFERAVKDKITPLLYYLRKKLHAPGNHDLLGWADWVEQNLSISRRTCDLWTSEYAKRHGLPRFEDDEATSSKIARGGRPELRESKLPDGKVQIQASWLGTKEEEEEFNAAWTLLGDRAGQITFTAVTDAAQNMAQPGKKKPSRSALSTKLRREVLQ